MLSLELATARMTKYIEYYNEKRLHSAINYVTPSDKLKGKEDLVFEARRAFLARGRASRVTRFEQKNNFAQNIAANEHNLGDNVNHA